MSFINLLIESIEDDFKKASSKRTSAKTLGEILNRTNDEDTYLSMLQHHASKLTKDDPNWSHQESFGSDYDDTFLRKMVDNTDSPEVLDAIHDIYQEHPDPDFRAALYKHIVNHPHIDADTFFKVLNHAHQDDEVMNSTVLKDSDGVSKLDDKVKALPNFAKKSEVDENDAASLIKSLHDHNPELLAYHNSDKLDDMLATTKDKGFLSTVAKQLPSGHTLFELAKNPNLSENDKIAIHEKQKALPDEFFKNVGKDLSAKGVDYFTNHELPTESYTALKDNPHFTVKHFQNMFRKSIDAEGLFDAANDAHKRAVVDDLVYHPSILKRAILVANKARHHYLTPLHKIVLNCDNTANISYDVRKTESLSDKENFHDFEKRFNENKLHTPEVSALIRGGGVSPDFKSMLLATKDARITDKDLEYYIRNNLSSVNFNNLALSHPNLDENLVHELYNDPSLSKFNKMSLLHHPSLAHHIDEYLDTYPHDIANNPNLNETQAKRLINRHGQYNINNPAFHRFYDDIVNNPHISLGRDADIVLKSPHLTSNGISTYIKNHRNLDDRIMQNPNFDSEHMLDALKQGKDFGYDAQYNPKHFDDRHVEEVLKSNTNFHTALIHHLARHHVTEANKDAFLNKFASKGNISRVLLSNPHLIGSVLEHMKTASAYDLNAISENPALKKVHLLQIAKAADKRTRLNAASHPNADRDVVAVAKEYGGF